MEKYNPAKSFGRVGLNGEDESVFFFSFIFFLSSSEEEAAY